MENETFHSDSNNGANVLGVSKLSKNLSSITEEDNKTSDLIKEIENYSLDNKKRETKFVINTIAYVPDHEFSDDSSSEETDGSFSEAAFNFDIKDESSFPFTTKEKLKAKIEEINKKLPDQFSDGSVSDDSLSETTNSSFSDADTHYNVEDKSFVYFTSKEKRKAEIEEINEELSDLIISQSHPNNCSIITQFLEKLSQNGFEQKDKDKLNTSISVSVGLNRMKSLSTRRNQLLHSELNSKMEASNIKYEKFGFFWECEWYENVNGIGKRKPVDQKKVRKFYKQLKTLNKEKAKHFREMQEKKVYVPYQVLREFAKNHDKTKKLVNEFRQEDPNANIYLSLIDIDTVDFNGIYSAYLRVVKDYNTPTVMSTGYEFPKNNHPYHFISQIDRKIRVITARHIPLGVYYPEPNTCVLIEKDRDTLLESFIDKTRKKGNLESACLLKEVQKRGNATFVFSDYNPLITTIPDRARYTKSHKTLISFTPEFEQGAPPTKKDIEGLKQVAQSSFDEYVWKTNLFINNGIKFNTYDIKDYIKHPADLKQSEKLVEIYVEKPEKDKDRIGAINKLKEYVHPEYLGVVDVIFKKGVLINCKQLVSKICSHKDHKEEEKVINELKKYVVDYDVEAIVKATKEKKNYTKKWDIKFDIRENEQKLLDILKEYKIKKDKFSKEKLAILEEQPLLELIEKEIITRKGLLRSETEELEYICYNEEILEALKNELIYFDDLLNFLKIFEDGFSTLDLALEEYTIEEILERYQEDPIHLYFMTGDPIEIVKENLFNNNKMVKIGIEYYGVTEIECPGVACVLMHNGEVVDEDDESRFFDNEEEEEEE